MNRFVQLVSMRDEHPSDDRLASLLCRELSLTERLITKRHLAKCWHCRLRKEDLEGSRAERMIRLYREAIDKEELSLEAMPRTQFLYRLKSQIRQAPSRGGWVLHWPRVVGRGLSRVGPAFAACLVLGVAGSFALFSWRQSRPPEISSNALLVRAEQWDGPNLTTSNGIVFQSVRITTPHQTLQHSIYRDPRGKRVARHIDTNAGEDQLRNRLAEGGSDWDEPISASAYQAWHDHQHVRTDKIVRADGHLLKLTTTVPDGPVSEESLTVRDADFHPVRRTIAFRDSETVEIAEVDFKILPWSEGANLFEAEEAGDTAVSTRTAQLLPLPRMPEMLTENQLAEAELGARLILNQLHADRGEQIEIDRLPQGVEVKGLVETEDRKRELQSQLRIVPHVTVSIESVADLKNDASSAVVSDGGTASMPDLPSPLESYLVAKGRSVSSINLLSRRLFNNALTISQESKAISDLQTRFASAGQTSLVASATLTELLYSHRDRLKTALRQQGELLAEAGEVKAGENRQTHSGSPFVDAATRNLALCAELTQSSGAVGRSVDTILSDMSASAGHLSDALRESNAEFHPGDSASNGKR